MDMLLDVVFEGIGIIFDLVESKIERAKCIKKVHKKKKQL